MHRDRHGPPRINGSLSSSRPTRPGTPRCGVPLSARWGLRAGDQVVPAGRRTGSWTSSTEIGAQAAVGCGGGPPQPGKQRRAAGIARGAPPVWGVSRCGQLIPQHYAFVDQLSELAEDGLEVVETIGDGSKCAGHRLPLGCGGCEDMTCSTRAGDSPFADGRSPGSVAGAFASGVFAFGDRWEGTSGRSLKRARAVSTASRYRLNTGSILASSSWAAAVMLAAAE